MSEPTTTIVGDLAVPELGFARLSDYFGYWMIEPKRFEASVEMVAALDLAAHIREGMTKMEFAAKASAGGYDYRIDEHGIAVVELTGKLMKHESSIDSSTSTIQVRRTIRNLARDNSVKAVITMIDSPGGSVDGAWDLAEDFENLSAAKPTFAYIADVGASAAYLQAAMHDSISSNKNALVGSIGTVCVVHDSSKKFETQGVRTIVISSGGFKGAGVPGTVISDEQIAEYQNQVNAINDLFVASVSRGREMSEDRVRQLADGRVHIADAARKLNLIDHVESFDALHARVVRQLKTSKGNETRSQHQPPAESRQGETVSTTTTAVSGTLTSAADLLAEGKVLAEEGKKLAQAGEILQEIKTFTPPPATANEIEQACPGASGDFKFDCAQKNMTLDQVRNAFAQWQSAQIRARDEEQAKLKKENDELKAENAKLRKSDGLVDTTALESSGSTKASNDPKSRAEQEWDSNFENCQASFRKKEYYVSYRTNELEGRVKIGKK